MQAIQVDRPGGPDTMVLREVEAHRPGPGQVLVRVRAAGVNFIDVYHRTGQYPLPMPTGIGQEGAGDVEAVGDGVDLAAGARVAWASVPGSYATHVIAPAAKLVAIPDAIDHTRAAALMLQGMTAHYLTQTVYRLADGDTCVVHAAAGGTGLLLCQLARRAGARAIGTTSTPEKAERARAAGAADVILYTRQDVASEVRRLTADRGVDVVYDSVGQATFANSLRCLAPRGMMVLFGQSSGAVSPIDPQILNQRGSLFLTRPSLFHYTATRDELVWRATDILSWAADGELEIAIHATLSLAEAAEAHRLLESRATSGKLLLRCD